MIDFVKDTGQATNTGQAIAAIAIETFMPPADFKRAVDRMIRDIRNSRRLPGVERIWLPGEQSHAKFLDRRAHWPSKTCQIEVIGWIPVSWRGIPSFGSGT